MKYCFSVLELLYVDAANLAYTLPLPLHTHNYHHPLRHAAVLSVLTAWKHMASKQQEGAAPDEKPLHADGVGETQNLSVWGVPGTHSAQGRYKMNRLLTLSTD